VPSVGQQPNPVVYVTKSVGDVLRQYSGVEGRLHVFGRNNFPYLEFFFLLFLGATITLGREVGPDAPSEGGSPPKVVVTLQETNYRYAPADVNSAGLSSNTNGLVFLPAEYNAVIFNTDSYNSLGTPPPHPPHPNFNSPIKNQPSSQPKIKRYIECSESPVGGQWISALQLGKFLQLLYYPRRSRVCYGDRPLQHHLLLRYGRSLKSRLCQLPLL